MPLFRIRVPRGLNYSSSSRSIFGSSSSRDMRANTVASSSSQKRTLPASSSSAPHTKMPRKHSKHVHFNEQEVYLPSPPSPTYSTSSLPSSSGPFTPPPFGAGSSHYYTPLSDSAGALHSTLGVGLEHVIYNLTTLPSTVTDKGCPLPPAILMEAATVPPVQSMVIQCPLLPWEIKVEPQKSKQRNFIVVQDFFDCLYSALRRPVTEHEFNAVVSSGRRYSITNAFQQRIKSVPDYGLYLEEQKKGLKRVDFLGESIMFDGLSADLNDGGVQWILQVSPPAPTHPP